MTLRSLSFFAVLVSGLVNSQTLQADDSAVVFMYHRFGEDKYPTTSIKVEQFRTQLAYLQDGGFNVIPLSDLMAFLSEGQSLPKKAVVITIDDAYRSIYEVAYPLLKEYAYPFTVFVSSDPVDSNLPNYLSWDQIREMASMGVTFANHGAGHFYMVRKLPGESERDRQMRISADIDKGWHRLTEELSDEHKPLAGIFAYPYGEYDMKVADQLQQRAYMAFGQQSGAVGHHSDQRALPRFPMSEAFAEMSGFRIKAMSRPLPVESVTPWDPVTTEKLPEIKITLAESIERADELACFVGGQGRVTVRWLEPEKRFVVSPNASFKKGRHRVNCTAPQNDGNYLWFSHQWIVQ
jgi:peptidoglycan/xylan/chitin deacetylase (PgdA/CDA1 family)